MTDQQGQDTAATGGAGDTGTTIEGVIVATEAEGVGSVVMAAADDQGNAIIQGAVADESGVLAEGAVAVSGDNAVLVARFGPEVPFAVVFRPAPVCKSGKRPSPKDDCALRRVIR